MARPLEVGEGATPEGVRAAYQAATDRHDRERLLAVHLAQDGEHSVSQIAQALWKGERTIKRWLRAFRQGGIPKLLERRHKDRVSKLPAQAREYLLDGLKKGRWQTIPEIRDGLREECNVWLSISGVSYWLRRLGARLKVPQTRHVEKKPEEVEAFQKEFNQRVEALAKPERKMIHTWVEDELRYGLNTHGWRVWTLRGWQPVFPYQKKREWGDLYGALEIGTGNAEFLHTSGVSLEWTQIFLQQLAATDPEGIHVVIMDGPKWHPKMGDAGVPDNVRILLLPPYSPELNPIEALWAPVKRATANAAWNTLGRLRDVIDKTLQSFWENTDRVRRLLGRNWTTLAVLNFLGYPVGVRPN